MNEDDLKHSLGVVANSGTQPFSSKLDATDNTSSNSIGNGTKLKRRTSSKPTPTSAHPTHSPPHPRHPTPTPLTRTPTPPPCEDAEALRKASSWRDFERSDPLYALMGEVQEAKVVVEGHVAEETLRRGGR